MKQQQLFEVDLTRIHGEGDFSCPKCGINISPEDETEQVYTIQEIKVRKETLEEVIIECKNCNNQILITGFLKF